MFISKQRAAIIAALAFSMTSYAQKTPTYRESAKDIIEKAQNLILQRDRQQALTILSGSIRREKGKAVEAELKQALNGIATAFLSDRAQQAYEASLSLRMTDINQSRERAQEAFVMEPDNLLIVLELARISILKADCGGAEVNIKNWIKEFTDHPQLQLIRAQIEICRKKTTGEISLKQIAINMKSDPELAVFWNIVLLERALQAKDRARIVEMSAVLAKTAADYPDKHYWLWKIETKKALKLEMAKKYLMACKNITAAAYRQYMMDPMICRRMSEDEADQKVPHASAQ
jgi:hypothetical protein